MSVDDLCSGRRIDLCPIRHRQNVAIGINCRPVLEINNGVESVFPLNLLLRRRERLARLAISSHRPVVYSVTLSARQDCPAPVTRFCDILRKGVGRARTLAEK